MVMVQINENPLKQYTREVLNELKRSEFESAEEMLPIIAHSPNAFVVGDIIAKDALYYVTDENGQKVRSANGAPIRRHRDVFNTIVAIEGGILKLDNGTEITANNSNIKCTDTWYTIWKSMQSTDERESIKGLYVDYQEFDGELWIVMTEKNGNINLKDRYRYSEVKNAQPGQKLKPVSMNASPQLEKSGFWITPETDQIAKSLNTMEGKESIAKDFILVHDMRGQRIGGGGQRFAAFDINEKDKIVGAFPWLAQKTALWGQPLPGKDGKLILTNGMKIVDKKTVKRCLPDQY